jgi:NAD(P)H dehydrogenase (quinone)
MGGGNETTVMDINKALMIHGMIIQGNPRGAHYGPVALGKPDERSSEECKQCGAKVARLVKRLAK